MTAPPVQFCVNPHGRRLAYATRGQGPLLVFPPGWISHLGVLWEEPGFRRFVSALAQHNTVVWFDRQGCGFSSRDRTEFSLDEDLLDLETVIAELPDQPLSLFAYSCAGPLAVTYAARHPERVTHLILYGTFKHGGGLGPVQVQRSITDVVRASWGLGARLLTELFVPSQSGEVDGARWFVRLQRESTSATIAASLLEATYAMDVTTLLPSVRARTLVLHRAHDRAIPERVGRELAVGIPGARFVLLDGSIHLPWLGDSDVLLRAITDFLGQPAPDLASAVAPEPAVEPRRYQLVHLDLLKASTETQARCRIGLAQIDVPFESFQPAGEGLVALRPAAVPIVRQKLTEMLAEAAARRIELLLFPELSLDLGVPELLETLTAWARQTGAYVVPGAFHVAESCANVCHVVGPSGVLWEQEKHIPASLVLGGRRVTEGIRPSGRRVTIADTRFGRIAVAICRDFLDLDLRVELKNTEPPIDIVLNPAFTPVTDDFEAAHFEARRSLYAYCLFCNAARFGNSRICSPEKEHRRRRLPPGREALLFKDVDLLALRAARRRWETLRGEESRFIQSTR
jgi:pimeloyl-ACP methyl ester carboxylesterase/predicted amidohydrolase